MILIVNESNKKFTITRNGSSLVIENDEMAKNYSSEQDKFRIQVAGLDSRLDEIFKDDKSVPVAAKRTTKLFLTAPDKVTTYLTTSHGCTHVNAIDKKEYLDRAKTKKKDGEVFFRMMVIVIGCKDNNTDFPVGVQNGDGVVSNTVYHRRYGTGEIFSTVLVIPSKWITVSDKNSYIHISETRKLHISYVTIDNKGKESEINALIRCDKDGKPIVTSIKQKKRRSRKKPSNNNNYSSKKLYSKGCKSHKKYNSNGNGSSPHKKPYSGNNNKSGAGEKKPYKKPYNKDRFGSNADKKPYSGEKKPWRNKPDNIGNRKRSNKYEK